jgi:hypothetical protein
MLKFNKRNSTRKLLLNQIVKRSKLNFLQPKSEKLPPKEEKYIYIMMDKYSVKPDKEIKITKNTEASFSKEIHNNQTINYFNYKNTGELIKKSLIKVFLPRDFPNSVRRGYYHFSKYAFYCGTCFHIMNFLSTQALITSLGLRVSRPTAFSLSAGMNWVLKDGFGQIGSIFFAAKYSKSIEMDLKKWRIISLWMYNLAMICDCLTLFRPEYFIFIASSATLRKKYKNKF